MKGWSEENCWGDLSMHPGLYKEIQYFRYIHTKSLRPSKVIIWTLNKLRHNWKSLQLLQNWCCRLANKQPHSLPAEAFKQSYVEYISTVRAPDYVCIDQGRSVNWGKSERNFSTKYNSRREGFFFFFAMAWTKKQKVLRSRFLTYNVIYNFGILKVLTSLASNIYGFGSSFHIFANSMTKWSEGTMLYRDRLPVSDAE